tara:strand:+ start:181 stop:1389 length:1209 start_codon:yes stop_codon:yes gene_type:complete
MKNIWYISKYVKTEFVGISGARGFYLCEELSKLGLKTIIFSSYPYKYTRKFKSKITSLNNNLKYVFIDSYKFKYSNSLKRIISWIDFEKKLLFLNKSNLSKPDLIIISSLSILTIINGLIMKRKYKCKLIFEIRDIWPLTLTEEGGFRDKNIFIFILKLIEYIGYKYSDHIIGTMPNLENHVANILGFPKKVTCIPIGYKSSFTKKDINIPISIKNKIPKNKFIVGYFGGLGVSNALNSFFNIICKFNNHGAIHFVIAGNGDLRKKYILQTKSLKNITWLPTLEKKFIYKILDQCDILYFSTHNSKIWEYGQSLNKIVDYMASGKPIIGSYCGYPTMINEANCGEYIKPYDEDALFRIILKYKNMTKNKREKIGLRGKKWILKNRSYQDLGKSLAQVIQSLN